MTPSLRQCTLVSVYNPSTGAQTAHTHIYCTYVLSGLSEHTFQFSTFAFHVNVLRYNTFRQHFENWQDTEADNRQKALQPGPPSGRHYILSSGARPQQLSGKGCFDRFSVCETEPCSLGKSRLWKHLAGWLHGCLARVKHVNTNGDDSDRKRIQNVHAENGKQTLRVFVCLH